MKKKRVTATRNRSIIRVERTLLLNHRRLLEENLLFLAVATQKAAKKLAGALLPGSNPLGDFDAYPVLFMYRHAAELYMKAAVLGEGGNFLGTKPDHISVSKTSSLSWLARVVSQIITALAWEKEFRCDGIEDLTAFKALIEEVNGIDLFHGVFRDSGDPIMRLPALLKRLDALLDLLNATTDALAAEWGLRSDAALDPGRNDDGGFEPTIQ